MKNNTRRTAGVGWVFGRGKVAQTGEIEGGFIRPFFICLLGDIVQVVALS